jgi:hypothetical protein
MCPNSETMLRPPISPAIATPIGRTIDVTVPKTSTRIRTATAIPINSLDSVAGFESFEPSWPPASTPTAPCAPARAVSRIACA